MTGLFEPEYHGELSEVDTHPRLVELVIRQRKALSAFTARQAQEYVRVAAIIRRDLRREG
jgi:hypothetical protein